MDVQSEPRLIPVTKEHMKLKTANTNDESRLDIKARGFWRRGETAFFDIRVTHVNSRTNKEKKREYLERVLHVEHGSFTPLVFGTNIGMGEESKRFVASLAHQLSVKQNETYAAVITWLRTRLSFEILRSALLCVRGSRTPFKKQSYAMGDDFHLNNIESNIV